MSIQITSTHNFKLFQNNIELIFHNLPELACICRTVIEHFHKLEKANGTITAIQTHKEILRLFSRKIMDQDVQAQIGPQWISLTKSGFPKYLKLSRSQRHKCLHDREFQRAMMTVLSVYKLVRIPVDNDISTITQPSLVGLSEESQIIKDIKDCLPLILKTLGVNKFSIDENLMNPLHVTTKAGANGPAAMGVTSIKDIVSVINENLLEQIESLIPLVFNQKCSNKILELIDSSIDSISSNTTKSIQPASRLHFISEGGGKTRVVCIGDIWTQIVLKPIHNFIMNSLKSIRFDGTSSHNNLAIKLNSWTTTTKFHCYDLKAATDRMPIILQREVLKHIFGETIAALWTSIISDRKIGYNGKTIKYAVGQPMGFLSSWAAMALTHHVIIAYSYLKAEVKTKDWKYCVIGDDMSISNDIAAGCYLDTLDKLGMPIAIAKSIVPNEKSKKAAEIAKRYFIEGIEISPITPTAIVLATNGIEYLLSLDRLLSDRSYYFNKLSGSDAQGKLDRTKVLYSLVQSTKKSELSTALIYASSPMSNTFTGITESVPLISKVRAEFWDHTYGFHHKYEQYLLISLAHKIVEIETSTVRSDIGLDYSPLVQSYFKSTLDEMKAIIKMYNYPYVDEEGDSDDLLDQTNPVFVAQELLSRPNPSTKPLFQRRAVTRVSVKKLLMIRCLEHFGLLKEVNKVLEQVSRGNLKKGD